MLVALLACAALAAEPMVLVGNVGGAPARLVVTVDGKKVSGTWQQGLDAAPVPVKGKAKDGDWDLKLGDLEMHGMMYKGRLSGSVTGPGGASDTVKMDDGADTPTLGTHTEQLDRATEKASGKTLSISLPVIWVADPAIQGKIDAALTVDALLGQSKQEILEDGWVDAITWEKGYAKDGIVCLNVAVEGSAAYPDGYVKSTVLDLRTGGVLGAEQWKDADALIARLDKMLSLRVRAARDPEVPDLAQMLAGAKMTADNLTGYSLSKAGVVFHYSYGLPHMVAAAEPNGDFTIQYKELPEHLAPQAALGRLAP